MGRHEIKLRRQRMTSRRIEGHKDYNSLLIKHKSYRTKRLVKLFSLLLFFIALIVFTYIALTGKSENQATKPTSEAQTISRPDVLINVNLNTEKDGKT